MDGDTYYQVLGVERGAGTSEIRRQYLALAKQYHPDHEGDTEKMVRLNEAYETLSNPQTRFLYNNRLDDEEIAAAADMSAGAAAPQYYETAPRAYSSVRSAPRRPARPLRREKRSWAGRVFSFATAVAVAVMLGAFIAGHIPKQSVTSALDVTSGSPSASGGAQGQTTAPAVAATDPAAETPVDGTLQPTNPAEVHYRCSLHYIASYKRMNCN